MWPLFSLRVWDLISQVHMKNKIQLQGHGRGDVLHLVPTKKKRNRDRFGSRTEITKRSHHRSQRALKTLRQAVEGEQARSKRALLSCTNGLHKNRCRGKSLRWAACKWKKYEGEAERHLPLMSLEVMATTQEDLSHGGRTRTQALIRNVLVLCGVNGQRQNEAH